jgi:hypothetical protein
VIESLCLGQAFVIQFRVLAQQRRAECRPEAFILPARIRHDPIEVVEEAVDQDISGLLHRRECGIDRQPIFLADKGKNSRAVADRIVAVDDIGKLASRRLRSVQDVLVPKPNTRKTQERKYLEAVAVVVGNPEQGRIGVQREHRRVRCGLGLVGP